MEAFSRENHGTVVNCSAHVCLPKANWKPWIYNGFTWIYGNVGGSEWAFPHPILGLEDAGVS